MKIFQQYKVLVIFSVLFVVGLLVRYIYGENSLLWKMWSSVDISFAVVLGILAFIAYRDLVRDQEQVRLVFNVENKREVDTGLCLLRKNCTRGEVIGILGMMKRQNKTSFKYDSSHLHNLLDEINRVQIGRNTKLFIIINEDEFNEFALSLTT